ncbi:MAG: M48 family metallopeptidase [Planctomycetaceae bacterium]|nr:M48 family metallopeptidase [Planctomycetaceae bacterium]
MSEPPHDPELPAASSAADVDSAPAVASDAAPAASDTAPPAGEMSPTELAEAKRYGRAQLRCEIADQLLDLAYLLLFAVVVAIPLDRWLEGFIASAPLRLLALFALVTLGHELVSVPLSYYSGFVLEHRFGLSRLTAGRWVVRHLKQLALALVLGGVMFAGLYAIIWGVGAWWWLCAALIFFVVSVVLTQLMPVVFLPLFHKIERLDDAELMARMARLAAGTGLSIAGVYRLDLSNETTKANAMLAGLGQTRRVLLGDTLLAQFTPDEIEVILAHEVGHHVHRHIRKLIVAGAVASVAAFALCDGLVGHWVNRQLGTTVGPAAWPVWTLPLVMGVVTAFFMVLGPLQNALSRRFERQCDRYALERTGQREAYISAFHKLARLNKDDPEPSALEVFLFHSHPPIAERLRLAEPR